MGDLSEPFTGPHFFTAFTFEDTVAGDAAFPAATVFVPRWQVSRAGQVCVVANVRVDADCDLDAVVDRVWAAYEKFSVFDYPEDAAASQQEARTPVLRRSQGTAVDFEGSVQAALRRIADGAFDKIVLSRAIELQADQPWQPLDALNRLRERFNGCFTFSFGGGGGRSFIGATPERLLQLRGGELLTEAIAGSAPRGATAREDAKYARSLLKSPKDLYEHACVRDSILRRLSSVGSPRSRTGTTAFTAGQQKHLRKRISAPADGGAPVGCAG